MSDFAIRVTNLSKVFRIYHKPSDMFWELISGKKRHDEFWGLKDVSFELPRGKMIGLIGHNGAGKSTLLKIIAGTLAKSVGEIEINGTITAILELGTGFHSDYSGRENIYLGGMCFGMCRNEIDRKIDEIIDFSELEHVIDQPFRTYSSGMKGRLIFSTALSIDPDILILDEALATGDTKFQFKCFSKFEQFKQAGKTIIFVSHNRNTVTQLCDKVLLLSAGELIKSGDPKEVFDHYYQLYLQRENNEDEDKADQTSDEEVETTLQSILQPTTKATDPNNETAKAPESRNSKSDHTANTSGDENGAIASIQEFRFGTKEVEIIDTAVLDQQNQRVTVLESGKDYTIIQRIKYHYSLHGLTCGCRILSINGVDLFAANTSFHGITLPALEPGSELEVRFSICMRLAPGDYLLTFGVRQLGSTVFCDRRIDTFRIRVTGRSTINSACIVNLNEKLSIHPLTENSYA